MTPRHKHRHQIFFQKDRWDLLTMAADSYGVSASQIIRDAVDRYLVDIVKSARRLAQLTEQGDDLAGVTGAYEESLAYDVERHSIEEVLQEGLTITTGPSRKE